MGRGRYFSEHFDLPKKEACLILCVYLICCQKVETLIEEQILQITDVESLMGNQLKP